MQLRKLPATLRAGMARAQAILDLPLPATADVDALRAELRALASIRRGMSLVALPAGPKIRLTYAVAVHVHRRLTRIRREPHASVRSEITRLTLHESYVERMLELEDAKRTLGLFGDAPNVASLEQQAEKARVAAKLPHPYGNGRVECLHTAAYAALTVRWCAEAGCVWSAQVETGVSGSKNGSKEPGRQADGAASHRHREVYNEYGSVENSVYNRRRLKREQTYRVYKSAIAHPAPIC